MLFTAFQIISQIVKSNHGVKIAVLFTLRESRGRRNLRRLCTTGALSKVRGWLQQLHPGTPWICSTLDFCSIRVYLALRDTNAAKHHLFALAFVIAFLYGVSDEIHQYFVPGRRADILDVVANGIGAFFFLTAFHFRSHYQNNHVKGRLQTTEGG